MVRKGVCEGDYGELAKRYSIVYQSEKTINQSGKTWDITTQKCYLEIKIWRPEEIENYM